MHQPKNDVERLIHRAQNADESALNQLLDSFRSYLMLVARGRTHQHTLAAKFDCSDVVQDAMVKAFNRFDQFEGQNEAELAAWLRRILANSLIDSARKYRGGGRDANRERSLDAMVEASSQALHSFLAASGNSPSQSVQNREMSVVLSNALDDLEPQLREVIILRNLQEFTWEAIAQQLGSSVGAVRALWAKALQSLRPQIEKRL